MLPMRHTRSKAHYWFLVVAAIYLLGVPMAASAVEDREAAAYCTGYFQSESERLVEAIRAVEVEGAKQPNSDALSFTSSLLKSRVSDTSLALRNIERLEVSLPPLPAANRKKLVSLGRNEAAESTTPSCQTVCTAIESAMECRACLDADVVTTRHLDCKKRFQSRSKGLVAPGYEP